MNIRTVRIDEIHVDPTNARRHGEKILEAIAASLKSFEQVEPLVVQKSSGRVIGGNGRLEVLRRGGASECDVVEVDLNDAEARALTDANDDIQDRGAIR
ncbi:MAG: ParB N-terminal domain-containing protein [Phycisphaerales bacterium]|nr:ParB N-terminal domain-containing protein [Phycisphaerales bacterium]